jgi:hydroxyethylthiazole kinase-like uncharacterized protein yjeF
MKILSAEQIKDLDLYTIEHEPVASIDLMERAAKACVDSITRLSSFYNEVYVFCGMGNNGGDGLAISRLLLENNYKVSVYVIHHSGKFSTDAQTNYEKLKEKFPASVIEIKDPKDLQDITTDQRALAIDALLGTGINKPVEGLLSDVITFINQKFRSIISIDVPSGLYIDKSSANNKAIVKATLCLTFHVPKLSFLMPENEKYIPEFEILDIGLDAKKFSEMPSSHHYVTLADIKTLVRKRNKFSHKGTFGHALLLAGSKGKSGAAVICAKGCLRSGAGLLTVHSNKETLSTVLNHLPETMTEEDPDEKIISEINDPEKYDALAFGPGTGTEQDTQQVLKKLLHYYAGKMVIDADGLNILSENKTWLSFLPASTILTPHPKEFERLTEKTTDDYERLNILKQFSLKHNCIVILKGAHSAIAMPDGNIFFNSSGNAGLAKGGAGDGLTGIILGLLARGYNAPQAALIGTFVHGYAADLCLEKMSMESMLISDVVEKLPAAFKALEG